MTAVFYANRSEANMSMVMLALQDQVSHFLNTECNSAVLTPAHRLARTQVLFIYQIIRLLDGDVILRSRSEKDMSVLETWLDDLCDIRDNLDDVTEPSVFMHKEAPHWHVSVLTWLVMIVSMLNPFLSIGSLPSL
jgi:hypothetical protein